MKNWKEILGVGLVSLVLCVAVLAEQNYVRPSGSVVYTVPTVTITNGDVVDLGLQYGIADGTAASGEVVMVRTSGIFEFGVTYSNTVAVNTPLYWTSAVGLVNTAKVAGTYIGIALTAPAMKTTVVQRVQVDLNAQPRGYSGTITAAPLLTNTLTVINGTITGTP